MSTIYRRKGEADRRRRKRQKEKRGTQAENWRKKIQEEGSKLPIRMAK